MLGRKIPHSDLRECHIMLGRKIPHSDLRECHIMFRCRETSDSVYNVLQFIMYFSL